MSVAAKHATYAGFGWLIAAIAAILGLRIASAETDIILPSRLQDMVTLSTSVVVEALPFVLLGIILSIIVQLFVSASLFTRLLPRQPVLKRAVLSLFGIFLPVCECGNVPLSRGLLMRGLSTAESLTFLLAAPILNPVTILATTQAFRSDHTILIARIAGAFLIANLVGWLFSLYRPQEKLLTPDFAAVCATAGHEHGGHGHSKWAAGLELFRNESRNMMVPLIIGSLVAGATQVLVPRDVLISLGANPVWSIAAMLALAFIISICANVDAFFALAFANTFTPGAIVSFLVFGPMVDIKMLTLMRTTYKGWVLVLLGTLVLLGSALAGLVVNYAF